MLTIHLLPKRQEQFVMKLNGRYSCNSPNLYILAIFKMPFSLKRLAVMISWDVLILGLP